MNNGAAFDENDVNAKILNCCTCNFKVKQEQISALVVRLYKKMRFECKTCENAFDYETINTHQQLELCVKDAKLPNSIESLKNREKQVGKNEKRNKKKK